MISNAITLAALTTVGGYLVYRKLPARAKHLINKYTLLTDVFALIGTYALFGGTVTALIAGAIVSILVSALLHIANHPDDFAWLFDMLKQVRQTLDDTKVWLLSMNTTYLAARG
jgi:hypothetical protein